MDVIEQARARKALRRRVADGSVRRIRARAGVSQEAMAAELRVGRDTLIYWESGQREPRSIATVVRWLALLDELDELDQEDQEDQEDALAAAGA